MSTNYTLKLRKNYLHVKLPKDYEITPEGYKGRLRPQFKSRREMKKSDFPAIRLMHMFWKQRLTDFLNGKETATNIHLSHEKCIRIDNIYRRRMDSLSILWR